MEEAFNGNGGQSDFSGFGLAGGLVSVFDAVSAFSLEELLLGEEFIELFLSL